MLFYSFPHANPEQYASHNKPIGVIKTISVPPIFQQLSLETRLETPLLKVTDTAGIEHRYDYSQQKWRSSYSEPECRRLAMTCLHANVKHMEQLTDFDCWIPWQHFSDYFPIYKYTMADPMNTEVYVSGVTGEIVQETNGTSRIAAYFGAIPHWVYLKQLRLHLPVWKNTVITLSGMGVLMCLSGMIIGIRDMVRVRRRRKNGFSPYKKHWLKWHHLLGLTFGCICFTYVLSGMMSLYDVPQWIAKGEAASIKNKSQIRRAEGFALQPENVLAQFHDVVKLEWLTVGEKHYYKLTDTQARIFAVSADGNTLPVVVHRFGASELSKAYSEFIGTNTYQINLQTAYDNYYRPSKKRKLPLPVYRIDVKDEAATSIYISPVTGEIQNLQTQNSRVQRWVYQFLHSFDSLWFINHPSIRLLLEVLLLLGGTALSVTGLVLSTKKMIGIIQPKPINKTQRKH